MGQKLEKKITEGSEITATDYQGGFHYENQVLKFFATSEGYVNAIFDLITGTTRYNYVYNYTDYLGNIRLSYTHGRGSFSSPVILEENHYYPFGLKHKKYGSVDKDFIEIDDETGYYVGIDVVPPQSRKPYQYKYNGKELQDELGLEWYDYHARNYDPAIGRWMNIDPLAETSRRWSPYAYAYNNPIRFIDPDGMQNFDVVITGSEMQKAFEQLQQSTQGQLNLSMDEGGKVTATAVEGVQLTEASQTFLNATEDSNVTVNLNATSDNIQADGTIIVGGVFEGSKMVDGVVEAYQTVNPNQMEVIDGVTQRGDGVGTLHEVLEAYVGAKNSNGKNTTKGSRKEKAYRAAHTEAKRIDPRHNELTGTSPLNGPPYLLNNGNGTYDIYFRVEYNGTKVPLFTEKNVKPPKRK